MLVFSQNSSGGRSFNIISVALHLFWGMEHAKYLIALDPPPPDIHQHTHTHAIYFIALEIDFLHTEYKNNLYTEFPLISLVLSHKYRPFLGWRELEWIQIVPHKTKT
jgi:hypothetical protein